MNLIAMAVLAPTLGMFVARRRVLIGVLVAVWTAILPVQTQMVLLDEQLDSRSYSNTIGYFVLNDVFLSAGIAAALLIWRRRRHRSELPSGSGTPHVAI